MIVLSKILLNCYIDKKKELNNLAEKRHLVGLANVDCASSTVDLILSIYKKTLN